MAELKTLPAVLKPLSEMDHAEVLDHLTGLALREAVYVFNLPREPEALAPLGLDAQKTQRMKLELVQTIGNLRAKVDDTSLRHQERADLLEVMREKLKTLKLPTKDD